MIDIVHVLRTISEARTSQVRAFINNGHPVMALFVVYRPPLGVAFVIAACGIFNFHIG